MDQLSAMDYTMLQAESSRAPQHISMVFFYDQGRVDGGAIRFKTILQLFQRSLHKSALFRRKLTGATMGLDNPYWMADPDFDLEFHVRHIALPKPGDWRQLCIQVARLHSRGIDLSRPPWEAYVIEGLNQVKDLPENSFALMLKIHHSAVDGVSMTNILNSLHSTTPEDEITPVPDDWQGEMEPTALTVWTNAWLNNVRRPAKLVKTLVRVVPNMVKGGKDVSSKPEKTAGLKTRFNTPVSAHRVVDALILDFTDVKAVKDSFENVTVNDVVLCIVGGALRKYLQAKGELPETSLVTALPLSARDPSDADPMGNQISVINVSLGTNVEDARERLQVTGNSARRSKEYAQATGVRNMLDVSEGLFPPVLGGAFKLVGLVSASRKMTLPYQTNVSNVPGAQVPLYMVGAKLHAALALGPLQDGLGLTHGVISYAGKISLTFIACREMLPDPDFYRQCLVEAWSELEVAAFGKKRGRKKQ